MKHILNQLFDHQKLTKEQAKEVLINISKDKYNPSQLAAFISVYLMRNISVDELAGFRDALLDLCVKVDFENIMWQNMVIMEFLLSADHPTSWNIWVLNLPMIRIRCANKWILPELHFYMHRSSILHSSLLVLFAKSWG